MISYHDIATEAAVSKMTVSRVMRGAANVSETTRANVLDAAERLGYQTNPLVSMLMTQVRSKRLRQDANRLAWIYPEPRSGESSIFKLYLEGAREKARELGFSIDEFTLGDGISPGRLREILLCRGIRGILLNPTNTVHFDTKFDFSGFAVVLFGYSMQATGLNRVTAHHSENQFTLLEKLREKGYRHIVYMTQPWMEERINFGWLAATMAFAHRYHGTIRVRAIRAQEGIELLRNRKSKDYPDAVVFNRPDGEVFLQQMGLQAPDEIGFATPSIEESGEGNTTVSGIHQCSKKTGACAVELLLEQINANRFGPRENPSYLLVKGSWHEGKTTRPTT